MRLLLLYVLAAGLLAGVVEAGWPAVYTTEHWLDLMTNPGGDRTKAARSGILVLYKPFCEKSVVPSRLDMDQHLIYATYDYLTTRNYIWYQYRLEDDLYHKYVPRSSRPDTCVQAFYFEKGASLEKPTLMWDQYHKDTLQTWVWSFLEQKVLITNGMKETVHVMYKRTSSGPHLQRDTIRPGGFLHTKPFLTYVIKVYTEDYSRVVHLTAVTSTLRHIRLQDPPLGTQMKPPGKEEDLMRPSMEAFNYWNQWVWSHAARQLQMIKQPLVVHNLTVTGFNTMPIPVDLYVDLKKYYGRNRDQMAKDRSPQRVDGVRKLESEFGRTNLVPLKDNMEELVSVSLKPLAEDWCNCSLKSSGVYGIRQYVKGDVVFPHVGRVDTNAIAVLLVISQEYKEPSSWPLQIFDNLGRRQELRVTQGNMLIYEAARMIHGHPQPVSHGAEAHVLVFFTPAGRSWDYFLDTEDKLYISRSRNIRESLTDFVSDFNFNKKPSQKRTHDEL